MLELKIKKDKDVIFILKLNTKSNLLARFLLFEAEFGSDFSEENIIISQMNKNVQTTSITNELLPNIRSQKKKSVI
jgi:hypothetical protein